MASEEARAHARERPPLAAGVLLGIAADEDHQDRNDRGRNHQQDGARRIPRQDVPGDHKRNEHAEKDLRQVAPDVGVELLDALGRRRGELARALPLRVRRPQPQDVRKQPLPQLGLHPHGPPLGRDLPPPQQNRTQHEGAEQQQKQPAHLPKIRPLQEHPVHDLAQGDDLQDRRRSRQQPERHREAQ